MSNKAPLPIPPYLQQFPSARESDTSATPRMEWPKNRNIGKRNSMPKYGSGLECVGNKTTGRSVSASTAEEGGELQLATELAIEQGKRQKLQQLLDTLNEELQQQAEKLAAEEARSEGRQAEVESLTQTITVLRRDIERQESHIDSAEQENGRLVDDLADKSNLLGASRRKGSELDRKLADEIERSRGLHKELNENAGTISRLQARLEEREFENQMLVEEIENHPLQRENEQLKFQLGKVNDDLILANQSLQNMEAELDVLRSEHQVDSKRAYTRLSSELAGLEESTGLPSLGDGSDILGLHRGQDGMGRRFSASSSHGSSTRVCRGFLYGESMVSVGTQTPKVKVGHTSMQSTEVDISATTADPQSARIDVAQASTQTEKSEPREMKNASVLTDRVTIVEPAGAWSGWFFILLMLASTTILLTAYFEEQAIWAAANDASRMEFNSRYGPFLSPWWYQAMRYRLAVWLQVDRVVPG